ncbi:MAG: hypothetical protein FWD47_02315 [Treponema sp.]|nr:hypothetical protein [Treponema sp.]
MIKRITVLLTVIILSGCLDDFSYIGGNITDNQPPLIWADELFTELDINDGYTKTTFSTNNKNHWTYEGFTMWTVWGDDVTPFESRTVKMEKPSGHSSGGYGIVFCHGEYEINGSNTYVMLVVMIRNSGQYIIGKVIGGDFTDFSWWKPFTQRTGINEIKVDYIESSNEYRLTINDVELERFSDDSIPVLTGGKNGYIAVVSPLDNFPITGININFYERR